MGKIQLYAIIVLLGFSILAGGGAYFLWNRNAVLKEELVKVQISREKAEKNLLLVSDQLMNEREIRIEIEAALTELREVSDVDYQTPLPPSIAGVLTRFRDRMQ